MLNREFWRKGLLSFTLAVVNEISPFQFGRAISFIDTLKCVTERAVRKHVTKHALRCHHHVIRDIVVKQRPIGRGL